MTRHEEVLGRRAASSELIVGDWMAEEELKRGSPEELG